MGMTHETTLNPADPDGDLDLRTRFWDAPPLDFDPLAHPEDLELYGLPPLPDPRLRPAEYRFWQKMYSQPLQWAQGTLAATPSVQAIRPSMQRWSVDAALYESSRNWSGLYITPRDGLMFTSVYGTWT